MSKIFLICQETELLVMFAIISGSSMFFIVSAVYTAVTIKHGVDFDSSLPVITLIVTIK